MSQAKYCVQLKHKTAPTVLYFIFFLFLSRSPKKDSKEDRMFKEKANNEKKGEIETLKKKSESPGW